MEQSNDARAAVRPRKGRGAVGNPSPRFEATSRVTLDDGWGTLDAELADPPRLVTEVSADTAQTIITRNDSPDVPFDRSINPYRGCEHGCVYCFARPSHAYLGLSPGLDFETKLSAKFAAAQLLEKELRRPGYKVAPLALGSNTDPYQPIEREHRITRQILEVLAAYHHPVTIVTKSALVLRDADLLAAMARENLARVCLSINSLDAGLARRLEPRAATPPRRLATIGALARAGVPVGVIVGPVIPGLNDHEIERVLEAAHAAGAQVAHWVLLRLPLEIKDLFREWLDAHAPLKAGRVLALIEETRGGKLNDSRFGKRQTGEGAYAKLIAQRFARAVTKLGLGGRSLADLECGRFALPPRPGDQLCLW